MEISLALQEAESVPTLDGVPTGRRLEQPSRATTPAEQLAVERAQQGDERAFAELVDRYGQPILSICYASTLDPAEAEDLAQEVFLAAWRGLRGFRGESAFSTWLFALARNRCVDRVRRASVRPRLAVEDHSEGHAAEDADASTRRTALAILAAAASLSLPLRQALLLRDVQGLGYEEIAELQEVPIGTVRSRIAAARAAVAEKADR